MLAYEKAAPCHKESKQKLGDAEVATRRPYVTAFHGVGDLRQQALFLGVSVLARTHARHQSQVDSNTMRDFSGNGTTVENSKSLDRCRDDTRSKMPSNRSGEKTFSGAGHTITQQGLPSQNTRARQRERSNHSVVRPIHVVYDRPSRPNFKTDTRASYKRLTLRTLPLDDTLKLNRSDVAVTVCVS